MPAPRLGRPITFRPTPFDPVFERRLSDTKPCRQHREGYSLPQVLHEARLALVVLLLFWAGPSAIMRLVIAIIILPVERFTGRALSHIGEKCRKGFPPLANLNPPSPVSGIFGVSWVGAALQHPGPASVGSRVRCSMAVDGLPDKFLHPKKWRFPAVLSRKSIVLAGLTKRRAAEAALYATPAEEWR